MPLALTGFLAEVALFIATIGIVAVLILVVGWSMLAWMEAVWRRRDVARLRVLLAHLYEMEVCCGTEFPQVAATVQQVRRLVLEEYQVGIVEFRGNLRARYGEDTA